MRLAVVVLALGCASARIAPVAPAASTPEVRFHEIARGFARPNALSRMRLCPVGERTFLCGGRELPVLRDRDLVTDPTLEAGLPRAADGRLAGAVTTVTGTFPANAWLTLRDDDDASQVFRWSGQAWTSVGAAHDDFRVDVVLRDGRPLVVRRNQNHPISIVAPLGGPVPSPSDAHDFNSSDLFGDDLVAAPRGELFVRRHGLEEEETEWFAPGAQHPQIVADPPGVQLLGLASSGEEVVAFGVRAEQPYLARFDGGAWRPLGITGLRGAIRGYASAHGETWALADGAFRKSADGRWREVSRPARKSPWDAAVFATGPGDVWLLMQGDEGGILERTIGPVHRARFD